MKIRSFMLLLAMLAVHSCNDDAKPDSIPQNREVNISFAAQTDVIVQTNTRAAVSNLVTAKLFTFYAFKKESDGNYSFEKKISDAQSTYNEEEKLWKSTQALLAVGTYRFICFYNLPDGNAPDEKALKDLSGKSWAKIKNGIVIKHSSTTQDMNEFFCGESDDDMQISDNDITVKIGALKRVVSRIDVKFVKIAEDGNEVTYSDGHTIFGASDNLQSIALNVEGAAKKFSLGTTALSDVWNEKLEFTYADESLKELITMGKSNSNSTFPEKYGSNVHNIAEIEEGIIKGGAYFRGAYILPFMEADKSLSKIQIVLLGKGDSKRMIEATQGLTVKKNFVTLVTVKLKSSTSTGPGFGNDNEHLFNPKVKFTVTVDDVFAGVSNSDVEVE